MQIYESALTGQLQRKKNNKVWARFIRCQKKIAISRVTINPIGIIVDFLFFIFAEKKTSFPKANVLGIVNSTVI